MMQDDANSEQGDYPAPFKPMDVWVWPVLSLEQRAEATGSGDMHGDGNRAQQLKAGKRRAMDLVKSAGQRLCTAYKRKPAAEPASGSEGRA